ncbi:ketoreductase [Fusarium albosuccineum]|uniref:Ketoreductase n=1 Tax=Fusarium albosuccineum TaxID=1237068 RepID=A0A8H4L9L9_9HYPO|nr:ketoreductase [Fusarium albosuccineum]
MAHPASKIAPFPLAFGVGTLWFEAERQGIDRKIIDGIKTALEVGYRHIDAAQMYNNETELGIALEESGVPRSEIFITTKTLDLDDPEGALKNTLEKLKTPYVDMYLIHAPFWATSPSHLQDAWRKMEACVQKGLAHKIGVSSFAEKHIETLLETATIRPGVVQVEMHPYLQQADLKAYLQDKAIPMEAFGCLASLTHFKSGPIDGVVMSLSQKHGVSESAVLLKWVIQQNVRVVTTSGRKDRLQLYLKEIPSFQLSQSEVGAISDAARDRRARMFFDDEFRALEVDN